MSEIFQRGADKPDAYSDTTPATPAYHVQEKEWRLAGEIDGCAKELVDTSVGSKCDTDVLGQLVKLGERRAASAGKFEMRIGVCKNTACDL